MTVLLENTPVTHPYTLKQKKLLLTLILVSTLRRVNKVFISIRACLVSLYTVPRKFRGRESWNSSPFTITRSPTDRLPSDQMDMREQGDARRYLLKAPRYF